MVYLLVKSTKASEVKMIKSLSTFITKYLVRNNTSLNKKDTLKIQYHWNKTHVFGNKKDGIFTMLFLMEDLLIDFSKKR